MNLGTELDVRALPDEELPLKWGRMRQKIGESSLQWRQRILLAQEVARQTIAEASQRTKNVKSAKAARHYGPKSKLSARSVTTRTTLRTLFEVPDTDHDRLATPFDADHLAWAYAALPIRNGNRAQDSRDNAVFAELRQAMHAWVHKDLVLRRNEARCDVNCAACPTARLLGCNAQNNDHLRA